MSSEIAIRLRGVGKAYAIYARPQDRLKQMLWRGRRAFYREFWALKDVDLEVHPGETVGIVGRNGSGKSTLLQIICGTLQPSCGALEVSGRIAALLELGAGFNPEFTGRENVFMNAAILGLSDAEIAAKYPDIVAFADIGDFVDQPVKSYSSGMYARLAFAVAINVDPDVLVVDEALAVGDEAFQRKCFSRIEEIRRRGAAVLFVSHSAGAVLELCDHAVLLDAGERLLTGEPKTVIAKYQRLLYARDGEAARIREEIRGFDRGSREPATGPRVAGGAASSPSGGPGADGRDDGFFDPNLRPESTVEYVRRGAEIRDVRILDTRGERVNVLRTNRPYTCAYEIAFAEPAFGVRCGMLVKSVAGVELGGLMSHPVGAGVEMVEAGTVLRVRFHFAARLNAGVYFLNAGVMGWQGAEEVYLHRVLDVLMLRIDSVPGCQTAGYVDLSSDSHCEISADRGDAVPARADAAR
jgi:lipopolysaccharide transport system ATP-binding protein